MWLWKKKKKKKNGRKLSSEQFDAIYTELSLFLFSMS